MQETKMTAGGGFQNAECLVALVEDGAEDAAAFRRVMADEGHVVVWPSGEHAVEALTSGDLRPDELSMLVVDMNLPGIDGVAVIRAVRAMPGGSYPAIFALSSQTGDEIVARAMAAGADDYIEKPPSLAGLRAVVQQLVSIADDRHPSD
ncbi:MAG: response regulator [Solirubrobacteraceae bacterium]|nr:response regulator [Solirubrobacteraceae bacterium]